ncbi:MAG: glycosyltransferase [Lachnospiraceae bacterium]|nr:glycosyltransferase [Lachnospiraceae bacterium]
MDSKVKKIAFHLNTFGRGGAERVVSNLANRFVAEGYTVYVTTEWQEDDEYALDERIIRIHVGLRPEDEEKSRVKKALLRIRYLRDFLKEYSPDVLIAFTHNANFRALMASRKTKIPTIIAVRVHPVGYYDSLKDKILIRWLFPKAAGAVFQTQEQKEFFKPYLQDNSRVIINPVNPDYIGVKRPEIKERAVVNHARIVDFKNHLMLVDAFLKVHEKHPDYVLKIFGPDSGDGTLEKIKEKIAVNNAGEFVFLMGSTDSIEKEIPKCEVYAYSSDYEGYPNSLLEAMVMGMPVVSTDCPPGAPAMMIKDGVNGFLVPVGDADALANRICTLIEDKELADRLGQEASKISEKTNIDAIYSEWKEFLDSVVK